MSLNKLGNVLVESGDLAGARARYEESLKTRQRLAATHPTSAQAQRDVAVSLWKLASLPGGHARWVEVVRAFEALDRRGALRPQDRHSLELARAIVALLP